MKAILAFMIGVFSPGGEDPTSLPLAQQLVQSMSKATQSTVDMKCLFRAQIIKEGEPLPEQRIILRFRKSPETIHVTFLEPHEGRKALYIRGENDGNVKVRPNGLLSGFVFSLDPMGDLAMGESIDPITEQGFPRIVRLAQELVTRTENDPSCTIEIDTNIVIANRSLILLSYHRGTQEKISLFVDKATHFPYRIDKRSGNNSAVYFFEDIVTNVGIPGSEFEL